MTKVPIERSSCKTDRLVIRAFAAEDFESWKAAFLSLLPPQNRFDSHRKPRTTYNRRYFQKLLKKHELLARNDNTYIYAVFLKDNETLVGVIDIHVLIRESIQMANLGYWIHNRHWRQGYATEAARAGLMIGFKRLKLNRIEASMEPDHIASKGVARSVGMRCEGIKKNYLFNKGRWQDLMVYVANPEDLGLKPTKPRIET